MNSDKVVLDSLFKSENINHKKNDTFYFVPNPDGTIRWIYPKSLKKPSFLSFYSTSSTRAKILASIFRLSFYFRLNKKIELEVFKDSIIDRIIKQYKDFNYSIFTGTIGINRKAIIELNQNNSTKYFVKVALTEQSKDLVNNEKEILNELNKYQYQSLIIPKIIESDENYITIDNIAPKNQTQSSTLNEIHLNALDEIYSKTVENKSIKDSTYFEVIKENLDELSNTSLNKNFDKNKIEILIKNMKIILESLNSEKEISFAYGHNDFTPWNMFVENNHLYLFDWELAKNDIVLLYDFFHFIFQSQILISKSDYKSIYEVIVTLIKNNSRLKDIVQKYNIDINENYKLYLLYTVSYYLDKYNNQEKLHDQVFWLIDVWFDAFNDLVDKKGQTFE